MYFKQFYLGCLAHASYLIGSSGEAVVVDPQRDVDGYLKDASEAGLTIKYIIETHMHADFVSGHRELAERTGAEIVVSHRARATFPHRDVSEGDALPIGDVYLWIIETPGHTPEGISVLAVDTREPGTPGRLLTGDTLFVGDVGRPDLVGSRGFSKEEMAGMLYDSLHEKLLELDDAVEVYPAHGAGSLCGRSLSTESSSTIGEQRRSNYALQPMSRDAFIRMMTTNLPEVPAYFPKDVERNRAGAVALGELSEALPIEPVDLWTLRSTYCVLDVRPVGDFGAAHVPGSVHIGLDGQFASWAGHLIPVGTPLMIVADTLGQVREAVVRLARVGIESVDGYLKGGIAAWKRARLPVRRVGQLSVDELRARVGGTASLNVIDVRRRPEFEAGHVPHAASVRLDRLSTLAEEFDRTQPVAVVCQSGYRSSAATSILEQMGFAEVYNVTGGTTAWAQHHYPLVRDSTLHA